MRRLESADPAGHLLPGLSGGALPCLEPKPCGWKSVFKILVVGGGFQGITKSHGTLIKGQTHVSHVRGRGEGGEATPHLPDVDVVLLNRPLSCRG